MKGHTVRTQAVLEDTSDERHRVTAVEELGLIGSAPEDRFNRITRLAQQVFGVQSASGFAEGAPLPRGW